MADEQQEHLKHLSEKLAERIRSEWPTYGGHDVRADAGDPGMIYVALRGAKRDFDAGEAFSGELESLLDGELDGEPEAIDFAISLGSTNKDLLLQIELRYV
ncbi:hypothetical protein FIV42_06210 [Persicimonas caeni]|jgi:hypothetical protein|uniref:DUF3168 domain-containing protein n=1 Tax=Persicimonas caeni TaxID=2292766 RepID=A0A4Y6PQF3_PERCE|nr:hypothetical protein [Persicimonas caeni]QDG50339.1 hypothetical protein FIV42_06210 [Persicimonas caeni]QED31560.1 hypothetical protein FRD00_06205 [Persicimonas caeni]